MPTYLLTPSATLNFSQHVGHKVEVDRHGAGRAAAADRAGDRDRADQRPENKPSTQRHAAADRDDDEDGVGELPVVEESRSHGVSTV